MRSFNELFNFNHTDHAEIFDEAQDPWDVLPLIAHYLEYKLKPKKEGEISTGAFVDDSVSIGKGTVVETGAVIHGPTIIGKHCIIRTGAYIRGNAIIGDNVTIGNSTEIKNALIFNEAILPHFNYVGDSILGNKVHLGSSVVLSNIKTPPSEILVTTLEKTYQTGLEKFGAIIGDKAEIGANAVLNPGTIIGKNSVIYPLALIRGVIQSDSIVKVRQQHEIVTKKELRID